MRLLGYARRSTDEQPTTLDVQVEAITGWAAGGGHELVDVAVETVSGSTEPEERPVLGRLLDRLAAGEADALVVTTTDRCARTQAVHRLDFYGDREGWALLILDALDRKQSPEAQLLHGIRVSVAAYERALIARRTRAALAYRKSIGVRIGRPRRCPDDVLARVLELRAAGARLVDVAAAMNDAGVPTPGGGVQWWPSHVSRLLATQDARTAATAPSPPADSGPGAAVVPAAASEPSELVGQGELVDVEASARGSGPPQPSQPRPRRQPVAEPAATDSVELVDVERGTPSDPAGRTVDLFAELDAPAGTWLLVETQPGSWQVRHHGTRVGVVRREATIRGRRGWLACLDTGVPLPARGDLAAAVGSNLWRTRDLAAAALARHVGQQRPTRRRRTR